MAKNNIFLPIILLLATPTLFSAAEKPAEKAAPGKKSITFYVNDDIPLVSTQQSMVHFWYDKNTYLASSPNDWLVEIVEEINKKSKNPKNMKNPFFLEAGDKLNKVMFALFALKTTNIENLRALPDEEKEKAGSSSKILKS
jgi:hypothetical protein